jgi:hypothetical protein
MDERDSGGRLPVLLGVAASLAAFGLIVGLLGYSFYHAFDGGDHPAPAVRAAVAAPKPTPFATLTPDEIARYASQPILRYFYVFVLCDGETVEGAIYSGIIYSDYVTLLATPDHDLIVDLAAGKPTILPSYSKVFPSACAKRMFNFTALE